MKMNLAEKLDETARFAIYFSPEAHTPLWELGTGWLGRDALSDKPIQPRHRVQVAELERQALTYTPAHYGLHATLKAPFELNAATKFEDLRAQLLEYCAQRQPFKLPALALKNMDDFVALVPRQPSDELNKVAQECVEVFDGFRQPLSVRELSNRQASPLTRKQHELLHKWGYPYVMESFRFHLTLTNPTYRNKCELVIEGLSKELKSLNSRGVDFDGLCLFYQAERSQPFVLLERFPFSA